MTMKKLCLIFISIAILSGCLYKPYYSWWTSYQKKGVSQIGVEKALFECGYDEFRKLTSDELVSMKVCMWSDGFGSRENPCKSKYNQSATVCQAGTEIPKRSVKRRMESEKCKRWPEDVLCEENGNSREKAYWKKYCNDELNRKVANEERMFGNDECRKESRWCKENPKSDECVD